LDHVYTLTCEVVPGIALAHRRRAVDIDVMACDCAARVLRDEPASIAVATIRRDVHAAAERNHAWVDGDRAVEVQRKRGAERKGDVWKRHVGEAFARRPATSLQRE